MTKENAETEKQQLKANTDGKEAYKKPTLSKHQTLRDITGMNYEITPPPPG